MNFFQKSLYLGIYRTTQVLSFDRRKFYGVTGTGVELGKFDRRWLSHTRPFLHAVLVQNDRRLRSTSFDDYIWVFSRYYEFKLKNQILWRIGRIARVYYSGHKILVSRNIQYMHFGNMDMNPFPFKNEFNNLPTIRNIYMRLRDWDPARKKALSEISEMALKRESARTDHKIDGIRNTSIFGIATTFLSLCLAYFALDSDMLPTFQNSLYEFAPLTKNIGNQDQNKLTILVIVFAVVWLLLRLIFLLYSTVRIYLLRRHKNIVELLDFSIRISIANPHAKD